MGTASLKKNRSAIRPAFTRLVRQALPFAVALLFAGAAPAQPADSAGKSTTLPLMQLQSAEVAGQSLNLKQYNGRVVLVSFFAAGCNLCSHEMKLMREFYLGNTQRNFSLLAVNIDTDKKDFQTYQQMVRLAVPANQQFPIIWRNAAGHQDNFGDVGQLPAFYIIDKSGHLMWQRHGSFRPEDWDRLWELLGA